MDTSSAGSRQTPAALFYKKTGKDNVFCYLCPQYCNIKEGQTGFCRVRQNLQGTLYPLSYGQVSSCTVDPIEKKPLYQFYPGSTVLSLGSAGCNLRCGFCQNWQIAQAGPGAVHTVYLSPGEAVAMALEEAQRGTCIGLAYTYNEPFVGYEYVLKTARAAREKGLKNILVTNGYVNEEPLRRMLPYIDAMNIDVKGFTEGHYSSTCAGKLASVMRTVEVSYTQCHVELTFLVVPGLNDSETDICHFVDWVSGLSPDIPVHFPRWFPNYHLSSAPTPLAVLEKAKDIARAKLRYVY